MLKSNMSKLALIVAAAMVPTAMAFATATETNSQAQGSAGSVRCWSTGVKGGKRGSIAGMSMWNESAARRSALRLCAHWGYSSCRIVSCRSDER